jgi:phenylacetate-coenzyme A ligase PaaK-like adenylate-forming protein
MRAEIEAAFDMHAVDIYGLSEVMGPGVANECVGEQGRAHHLGGPFLSRDRQKAGARRVSAAELCQHIKGVIGVAARITVTNPASLARSQGKARRVIDKRSKGPNPLG